VEVVGDGIGLFVFGDGMVRGLALGVGDGL